MEEFDMDTIFVFAEGVKTREEDFGLLVISKTTPALSLNIDSKFITYYHLLALELLDLLLNGTIRISLELSKGRVL